MAKRRRVLIEKANINTFEEADDALKNIAVLESLTEKLEASYNAREQEARAKLTAETQPKRNEIKKLELGLEAFALANRSEFVDKKTKFLKHGSLNFRIHPPAVGKLTGVTWKAVVELTKAAAKWKKKFIRTTEAINKDAVLAAANAGEIKEPALQGLGMTIERKETFGYETKLAIETNVA